MTRSEKIQDVGQLLRFVTPILLAVVGFFAIEKLNHIDQTLELQSKQMQQLRIKVVSFENYVESFRRHDRRISEHETRIRNIEIENGRFRPGNE
jgi:hypothetical protein